MKQKFRQLSFVKIAETMPPEMLLFLKGFIGIVKGTYSQMYGGEDIHSYSVYQTDGDKIINQIAWYREDQLTLTENQDKEKAEEMIEEYNLR